MDRRSRGQRFKDARDRKKYTLMQAQIATHGRVNKDFIDRIEKNKTQKPDATKVLELAKIYEVPFEYLMYGEEITVNISKKQDGQDGSEIVKLGTLSRKALDSVIKTSDYPNYNTLNALLSDSQLLYRLVTLIDDAKKRNAVLSTKISRYLRSGKREDDMDIRIAFTELRHLQRDTIEDIERLFRPLTGYATLEKYMERYNKMLEEEENGES